MAGITSDANILINRLRLTAQQHAYSFSEPMPVEQLVTSICDYKQLTENIMAPLGTTEEKHGEPFQQASFITVVALGAFMHRFIYACF